MVLRNVKKETSDTDYQSIPCFEQFFPHKCCYMREDNKNNLTLCRLRSSFDNFTE